MDHAPPVQLDRALFLERELRVAEISREHLQASLSAADARVAELEAALQATERALAAAADEPARLREQLSRSQARLRAAEQLAWSERAEREAIEEELDELRRRHGSRGPDEASIEPMLERIDELQEVVSRLERSLAEAEHAEAAREALAIRETSSLSRSPAMRSLASEGVQHARGPGGPRIQVDRLVEALDRLRATVEPPRGDPEEGPTSDSGGPAADSPT